jgi:RimJ/RimL family protein N-acetyltransferase
MVRIKTRDFILRPIRIEDAEVYLELHKDKYSKRNFMSVPKNLKEARKEITEGVKGGTTFAIEVNGEFAGFIHLELNKKPHYKHSADVGYGIMPQFRGKGLATKVLKAITSYGFNKLGLKRIWGSCRTFNKASARVLEKAGYKLEGILRKNKFKEGKYLDDMLWAKVR